MSTVTPTDYRKAQTIFRRAPRDRNFTILPNAMIEDANLSWGARGVLSYLLSRPDNWTIRFTDLLRRGTSGRDQLRGYLAELRDAGYLLTEALKDERGRFVGKQVMAFDMPRHANSQPQVQQAQRTSPLQDLCP